MFWGGVSIEHGYQKKRKRMKNEDEP